VWALLSAATGLLWSPNLHPQAQQQDRQLVQTGGEGGQRLALVIGNGKYTNAPPLKNPPNDARDMADALSRFGFTVEHGVDLDQKLMKQMIRQFGQKLKSGGRGVFYYAGHGVQSKGRNYLIPVDAMIESEADIEDQGVDVQLMLDYMDDAQNGLNIVILDACRNNPFGRSMRSAENGLAKVNAPTGTLIAYATAPGRVASDNPNGKNGLYTSELLKQMRVPGLSVTDMLMRVRAEVVRQTGGKQVPWEESSLIGFFSFNVAGAGSGSASKPSAALKDAATVEAEYWESIQNSRDAADYQGYLKEYPRGRYTQLARLKLRQLETAKSGGNDNAGSTTQPDGSNSSSTTTGPKAAPRAGTVVRNKMGMEFAFVPAGSFMMGSIALPSEKPRHKVTIREGFYMGQYEVTQGQWQSVMGNNPAYFKNCDQCPVEQVSWNDAQEFIRRLNERGDGYTYRLPSEAEWEYACRAGTTGDYAGTPDAMAWYYENSGDARLKDFESNNVDKEVKANNNRTHPVGQKQPNGWGLYDMHGNVSEWCEDLYHESYNGAPSDGSAWLSGGEQKDRVLRGGSWGSFDMGMRSTSRLGDSPGARTYDSGLRVVAVART
jgi:formylglycine-generating enzyme required for sulfatase activity